MHIILNICIFYSKEIIALSIIDAIGFVKLGVKVSIPSTLGPLLIAFVLLTTGLANAQNREKTSSLDS